MSEWDSEFKTGLCYKPDSMKKQEEYRGRQDGSNVMDVYVQDEGDDSEDKHKHFLLFGFSPKKPVHRPGTTVRFFKTDGSEKRCAGTATVESFLVGDGKRPGEYAVIISFDTPVRCIEAAGLLGPSFTMTEIDDKGEVCKAIHNIVNSYRAVRSELDPSLSRDPCLVQMFMGTWKKSLDEMQRAMGMPWEDNVDSRDVAATMDGGHVAAMMDKARVEECMRALARVGRLGCENDEGTKDSDWDQDGRGERKKRTRIPEEQLGEAAQKIVEERRKKVSDAFDLYRKGLQGAVHLNPAGVYWYRRLGETFVQSETGLTVPRYRGL